MNISIKIEMTSTASSVLCRVCLLLQQLSLLLLCVCQFILSGYVIIQLLLMLHKSIRGSTCRPDNLLWEMICLRSFVKNNWSLTIRHTPPLEVLKLCESIAVLSALSGPLARRRSLGFECGLRLIRADASYSASHGRLCQWHRMTMHVIASR